MNEQFVYVVHLEEFSFRESCERLETESRKTASPFKVHNIHYQMQRNVLT